MTDKLLPCPFCGSSAHIERVGDRRQSTIYQCDNCSCSLETGEEWDHGRDWNRRAEIPAPVSNVEGARYIPVGFQWRGRASADDLWSPWRDGPCPALAPKGSETEERRVYALITEGSDNA